MKRAKRLWMPVLLGMLLMAAVAGVAGGRPDPRPQGQAWRVLAVPAQACIGAPESINYTYQSAYLKCLGAPCFFFCPIDFPAAGEQAVGAINVKRLTEYVLDNDATASDVISYLRKTYPMGGDAFQVMGVAMSAESIADPQAAMDTSIENNPIYRSQAPYVFVAMWANNHRLYGLYVHYTW